MIRHLAIGLLALASGVVAAQAQSGASLARGKYLVDTVMTCQNCHTPRGPNGLALDKDMSGALRFNEPPFDVTAANITSDKETGIGSWSLADIKKVLITGLRPNGVPVALSDVMLAAVTSNGGSLKRRPPDRSLSSIRPFGPRGVWQFWQVITVSTRYLPRASEAPLWACAAPAPLASASSPIAKCRIIVVPVLWKRDAAGRAAGARSRLPEARAAASAIFTAGAQGK